MASAYEPNDTGNNQRETGSFEPESAPLTEEEIAYLLGLTNPYYWQTPTLDLHHSDAGIWTRQYNEIFDQFIRREAYSPSIQSEEHFVEPPPEDVTPLSELPPQSPPRESPPQSPPPSYVVHAGSSDPPAWQPVERPDRLQWARSGATFIVLPRYRNIQLSPRSMPSAATPISDLESLYRFAPGWRTTISWVRHYYRYRLPRRRFWLQDLHLENEIRQEFYVYGIFQMQRLGIQWQPGPEFVSHPGTRQLLFLGSLESPLPIVLDVIRNDYHDIQSWYTDAIISRIYPLVESGEFGSRDYLAGLLEGDQIFHHPSVFHDHAVVFGSRLLFRVMTILLGTGTHSIQHHWEGLSDPSPHVPGYTVALASAYTVLLVRRLIFGDLSFTESVSGPVYNRALRVWLDMLQNPDELQGFIYLDTFWVYGSR